MRRTTSITLTAAASMGVALAGQSRVDPCGLAAFNESVCEKAVQEGGYYWDGKWTRMKYSQPYPYYYDLYREYLDNGGPVSAAPTGAYDVPVTRGGFGSTGAGQFPGG
jgi:hypothetical protein